MDKRLYTKARSPAVVAAKSGMAARTVARLRRGTAHTVAGRRCHRVSSSLVSPWALCGAFGFGFVVLLVTIMKRHTFGLRGQSLTPCRTWPGPAPRPVCLVRQIHAKQTQFRPRRWVGRGRLRQTKPNLGGMGYLRRMNAVYGTIPLRTKRAKQSQWRRPGPSGVCP
jgi:hypothetical protein